MRRSSPQRVGIHRKPSDASLRPWRRSVEFSSGVLGRAAPPREAVRPGHRRRSYGPRPCEDSTGPDRHPEPFGARRGPALHAAITDELWNRHRFLSARIVHDEIQPEIHGGTRGPPHRDAGPSGPRRVDRPRSAPRPLRVAGPLGAHRGDGRGHVAAGGGRARRVHGPAPGASVPPGAGGGTTSGHHPRHGTHPASAGMLGFDLIEIPSKDGRVDLKALEAAAGPKTLALMLTNPNTLGIFEEHVLDIAQIVHDAGGLLYYDGANFNAILGRTSPGKMNFDIVHFNLHKTFTTPHGGGGPGAGPVGVKKPLEPFLPVPVIGLNGRGYHLNYDRPKSIGKVRAWYGNFALLVRAYAYILRMGGDGLKEVSDRAVLNANYLRHRLAGVLDVPFGGLRKHEFVASAAKLAAEKGVRTVDLAKRLMDFGYHPPTVYFPHLVEEALMVEPTETETKETLDGFVDALTKIVKEDPETLHSAPHNTAVARVDEVQAAREPILSWRTAKARKPVS